ncbi:ABC transporter ATP-binding protein [Flavobacterium sp.]|uniref:ABC transporter ATP-binding protein n=1 Tax=Flavobacterium sp. TaxID=239 RepID=UPI00286A5A92|nr:ABC transporter ATP-binding protein [Flavobacterium sp.]
MLEIKNISFAYQKNLVIDAVSFTIDKGQNVAIIGQSGCGKSTLLKLIYGLYDLKQGTIFYNNKPILGPKFNLIPGEDYIKYLAQDFDLMPYITVEENVGKFLSNMFVAQKKARVQELLALVEMTEFAREKAKNLSGGQQQRIALARVLALEPEILLLDEPFSQIDTFRKNSLRRNLFGYLKQKQITCIIATHDSTDALSFSDETIVMQNGKISAINAPKILFENPTNTYIASLFGEVNELPIHLLKPTNDHQKTKLIYAHQLKVVVASDFKVVVKHSFFRGNHYLIQSDYLGQAVFFESKMAFAIDSMVFLALNS